VHYANTSLQMRLHVFWLSSHSIKHS